MSEIVNSIRQRISHVAAAIQLAEEASELAKAAAKLARIEEGTNPTPVTYQQAWDNLLEELNDVINAAIVLGLTTSRISQFEKLLRWRDRLKEQEERNHAHH